jgi:hypothetical protein
MKSNTSLDYGNEKYEVENNNKMVYPICDACSKSIRDDFIFTRSSDGDILHIDCFVFNKQIKIEMLKTLKNDTNVKNIP